MYFACGGNINAIAIGKTEVNKRLMEFVFVIFPLMFCLLSLPINLI